MQTHLLFNSRNLIFHINSWTITYDQQLCNLKDYVYCVPERPHHVLGCSHCLHKCHLSYYPAKQKMQHECQVSPSPSYCSCRYILTFGIPAEIERVIQKYILPSSACSLYTSSPGILLTSLCWRKVVMSLKFKETLYLIFTKSVTSSNSSFRVKMPGSSGKIPVSMHGTRCLTF